MRDLGYRLSGSSDLFGDDGRRPFASVNFVTAHDGFTLRDLVSYDHKHNEANGEDNRDGSDNNRSWNYGVEGETDDPAIIAQRRRHAAQHARHPAAVHRHPDDRPPATSWGAPRAATTTPTARTTRSLGSTGSLEPWQADLLKFSRLLLGVRARTRRCGTRHFFEGRPAPEGGAKDLAWFGPGRRRVTDARLVRRRAQTLGMYVGGDSLQTCAPPRGEPSSTRRSCCCCTPAPSRPTSPSPARPGRRLPLAAGHRRRARRPSDATTPPGTP